MPAWHEAITMAERMEIERVQKSAAHVIIGESYVSYKQAIMVLNWDNLQSRRDKLSSNFAKKAEKNDKFQKWFKLAIHLQDTRQDKF